MRIVKQHELQLCNEIHVEHDGFRVGYCEPLQAYLLMVWTPGLVSYERYFWISEDDYNLCKHDAELFRCRYQQEIHSLDEGCLCANFIGASHLCEYDCIDDMTSVLRCPEPAFVGYVVMHDKLWACLLTDVDALLIPPLYMSGSLDKPEYPLRCAGGVRLIYAEIAGAMQPLCYGIPLSEVQ